MAEEYADRWIRCTADGIEIRSYYFPLGTKRIPYPALHHVQVVQLSALRGRARIWGTANPGYWAGLDPDRRHKKVGIVLDLGRGVKPLLTPEDPGRFIAVIRANSTATVDDEPGARGPLI